jgi:hypothetical protein
LDRQIRKNILRYIDERKKPSFTDIKNATRSPDGPVLFRNLKTLATFIEQKEGKYDFNHIGKAAYTLLLRTITYNRMALLHKKKVGVLIGHIALCIGAIAAGLGLKVDSFMTTIILLSLVGVSLMTINELFE